MEGTRPERRRQILEAALRVFADQGYGKASIRRIAQEAGLRSPPLVYWYFENKEEMFLAVLAEFSPEVGKEGFEAYMERPPAEVLVEVARSELRSYEDPTVVRLLRVAVAESALDPRRSERFVEGSRAALLDFLTRYLERCAERGEVETDDARSAALAFFGSVFFYVLNREVFPHLGGDLPEADRYAVEISASFLRGIAPKAASPSANGSPASAAPEPVEPTPPQEEPPVATGSETPTPVAEETAVYDEPSEAPSRGAVSEIPFPAPYEPEDAEPEEPDATGPAAWEVDEGRPRKALFFVLPVGGHVRAALPLAQELARRGDEVLFYATEPFEGIVRDAGVGFRVLDPAGFSMPEEIPDGYLAAPRERRSAVLRSIADGLRETPGLVRSTREEDADYVVYDPVCPWGWTAAAALGLPAVALHTSFAMVGGSPLARRLLPALDGTPSPAAMMPMVRLRWELREARASLGLPQLRPSDLLLRPGDLNIVGVPEPFQPPSGGPFDESFVFTGPSPLARDERAYFSLKDLETSPTLYVSLGPADDARAVGLHAACREAFGETRWLVVLETGAGTDLALLGEVPPNFLAWPRVPRLEVMRRCDVFVSDGDPGSAMEALWFGVPTVVVPRTPDGEVIGERVSELGMGAYLPRDKATATDLRRAVDEVGGEDSDHSGLEAVWKAARHAGGHVLAADKVRAFVDHAQTLKSRG